VLGNGYFHIYLIKGSKACALVETGISATADLLMEQLLYLRTIPDYIIVTHPHSDHITGLDSLRKSFPEASVMTGRGAESFVRHPKAATSMIAEDIHMLESMKALGLCTSGKSIISAPMLSETRIVNSGDEVDLGDLTIRFLEARGHSPGNILVHIPDMNAVLVSDSLGNHYPGKGFFPTFFTGYQEYMETMDDLQTLDTDILGLAHNGLFLHRDDIKNIFQKAREDAVNLRKYIIANNENDDDLANRLFELFYMDELSVYSPRNILNCCRLLVKRSQESNSD
ncbi:MAG: MBL fold metallo-hydrolase, partial [Smithella sp.]|nr:MBL fold metallo-hydrolase [Smithella sp.]